MSNSAQSDATRGSIAEELCAADTSCGTIAGIISGLTAPTRVLAAVRPYFATSPRHLSSMAIGTYIGVGLFAGMAIGEIVFDDMGLGIVVGLALGAGIGSYMAGRNRHEL